MPLAQKLTEDIKNAMKSGDSARLSVLRLLNSQLKNQEIAKRGAGSTDPLSEEEAVQVFQKEAKKRREAIDLYAKGGRPELAKQEEYELGIIHEFIPAPLSREEIAAVVAEIRASGKDDFNALMKEAMQRLKGRADGKTVGEVIRETLGS